MSAPDTIQDTGKAQRQYGLIRHYTYLNGDPCLVIRPALPRLGATAFAVRQDDVKQRPIVTR